MNADYRAPTIAMIRARMRIAVYVTEDVTDVAYADIAVGCAVARILSRWRARTSVILPMCANKY